MKSDGKRTVHERCQVILSRGEGGGERNSTQKIWGKKFKGKKKKKEERKKKRGKEKKR